MTTPPRIQAATKSDALKAALVEMARQRGAGARFPTVREICRDYRVSLVTVDRVLCELQAMGIVSRQQGRGIFVSQRASAVALVFGRNIFDAEVSPICRLLLHGCEQRAAGRNFRFYLDVPRAEMDGKVVPAHQDLMDDMAAGRVSGILLVWRTNEAEEQALRQQGVPLVAFVTGASPRPGIVCLDYGDMVAQGVDALAAQGCRRIALITPLGYVRPYDDDLKAYHAALARHGLLTRAGWLWENRADGSVGHGGGETRGEQGFRAMRELLDVAGGSGSPDGVLILDDMLTRGALAAVHRRGLVLGRDIRIATHGNKGSPVLDGYEDALTLLEADPDQIAAALFGLLEPLMTDAARQAGQGVIRVRMRAPRV